MKDKGQQTNKEIPCKTCILLAMCKHRQAIECNLLYDWNFRKNNKSRLTEIRETLKNLNIISICGEQGQRFSVIYTGGIKDVGTRDEN